MDRQDLQHPQTPLLPLVVEVDEFGGSSPQTQLSKYIDTSPSIREGDSDIRADARTEHIQEHVLPSTKWPHGRIGPPDSTANLSTLPTTHNKRNPTMEKILGGVSKITHPLTTRIAHLTRKSGFHGWRMGVLLGCCMSAFVLCCNIAIIVVGASASYNADGISDIVIGDEATVSRWNTAFHVLINALSTMLLAGSNYTMQVLCSPSREDIDAAHAKGEWLDIGLLSPRNLQTIPRKRKLLWYTLGLSSIPLHLFYNAAIFKVVTSSDYNIVTLDILSDEWNRINSTIDVSTNTNGGYWNMSNNQWNDVYNNQYLSVHGDLFLAIDRVAFDTTWSKMDLTIPETMSRCLNMNTSGNISYLKNITSESPAWIRYEVKLDDSQSGTINISAHVAGAASQRRQSPPSRVQASLHFLLVVAVFNLIKLVVMAYVLVTDRSAYVVTLGDAIASFLQCSDPHTIGKCLLGREELLVIMGYPPPHPISSSEEKEDLDSRTRGLWLPRPRHYFFAVHRVSKIAFTMLFLIVILLLCLAPIYTSANGTWDWGTASTDDLSLSANRTTATATLWNAWLANAPQLLLSICYLNVNMICTSMAGAEEWNNLASTKKGLRVTKPYGYQRSTYFLQLPYRWSVPLIVSSGTLHWLLSQTFFLVRVDFFDRHSQMIETASKSTCGFSSLSLFVFLSGLILLLGTIGFVGLRKMSMKLPVVASCSLAISAACHPSPNEVEPHLALVQWGVTEHELVQGFCHCSISSEPVKTPVIGIAYR